MRDLEFDDLTDAELDIVSDGTGCGAKGADVPDWIFLWACLEHDFDYWVGGTEQDRYMADRRFRQHMLEAASYEPWYVRWWYQALANVYYAAVRYVSKKFFYYGEPRGRAEMDAALREAGVHVEP